MQDSQETGGKGDTLMVESATTAGQNATEEIRRKSYSEVVVEGVRKTARMFVGNSIVRKTDRALSKGIYVPWAKNREGEKKSWVRAREVLFWYT